MKIFIKLLKNIKKGLKYLFSSSYRYDLLFMKIYGKEYDDEKYIRIMYKRFVGRKLHLKDPRLFSEKLQWLKLYDKRAIHTAMVDKYQVKEYVGSIIGNEHIVPTLGVWDNAYDIDFDLLPQQFVLKCNHNSGKGMFVCADKNSLSKLDKIEIVNKLNEGLEEDYYLLWREWPYKNVPRKIIAEKYLSNTNGDALIDYKFFCFNGVPRFLYITKRKKTNDSLEMIYLSLDWKPAPYVREDFELMSIIPPKPSRFDEMISFAKRLAKDEIFVRVDFYEVNSVVYFSELTFYPGAGLLKYKNNSDYEIGQMLDLHRTHKQD